MRQLKSEKSFSAVAHNLRAMRGGLSQAEFARFLGIPNQVTYYRYESGRVPKALILKQLATRLGITLDEFLSPIPKDRAFDIVARSITAATLPKSPGGKLTPADAKSFGEASGELIKPQSVKAINSAFHLQKLSHDELSRLFEHVVMVANRAPVEVVKYYVLIHCAIGEELARRWKL